MVHTTAHKLAGDGRVAGSRRTREAADAGGRRVVPVVRCIPGDQHLHSPAALCLEAVITGWPSNPRRSAERGLEALSAC